jgi:hypothetical protein
VYRKCTFMVYRITKNPQKYNDFKGVYFLIGSGGRDRTYDQLINSQLLYR